MKIIILTFSFSKTGGIEQVAKNIYNSLALDHDVKVISIDEKLDKCKNKFSKKIYQRFLLSREIKKEIRKHKSDLIISLHPFLLKYIDGFLHKTICWVHGIDVFGINGIKVKKNLSKCSKIVSVSSFTKNHLIEELNYTNNIQVINNCVDINIYKYSENNNPKEYFNLLTVGRLAKEEQYKGHDLVIKSLNKLQNNNKTIIYTIVGDGDDIDRLKELAKSENVEQNVIFKGKVSFDNILKEYKKCDLFIMPSFFKKNIDGTYTGEGFGIVYIEAGAIGRAVIGCSIGGQEDCIIDNFNGKLVEPNEEDIARKIDFFIKDEQACYRMGINNRKLVEKKFTFEIFKKNIKMLVETM
jgi:phosphatidylinositol alpha-1,6-mannosyltransferase